MKIISIIALVLIIVIAASCNRGLRKENDVSFPEPDTRESSIVLENETFRLKVDTTGGLNPYSLFDKKNGVVLANDDYYYGFGRPENVIFKINELAGNIKEITFSGTTNNFEIRHVFLFPANQDWFEEYVAVKNLDDHDLDFSVGDTRLRHGFRSNIGHAENDNILSHNWRIMAVPYLIHTETGERNEYNIQDLFNNDNSSHEMASEGWIMTNDRTGILVKKYSQQQMEYSLINAGLPGSRPSEEEESGILVWGGSDMYRGDPEIATSITSNQTLQLGLSRYTSFSGHWKKGFYLFRAFMDEKGHRFPEDFNPPVHWNEIYDNPLWWHAPDTPEKRAEFYQLEDMEIEAAKAAEIGCEALYLDPGWDTKMGSTIWADDRLMSGREFVNYMEEKYNLKVALHTPLAVWNDESEYPESARKPFPVNDNYLCSGAPGWWRTKLDRLLKLASDGIVYFMFDGTNFTGPCEVKEHGHTVPYTREEHIRNYARLGQQIKEKFPDVLIEMHDQVLGPTTARYVPTYYTHDFNTFDAIWAFEYMWDPMTDLVSGLSRSLYYYNLAYNIPLYVHVNLKTDNENALMFWWYASTCRYLGIGGRDGVKAYPPWVEETYAHLGIGEKNSPPPGIWQAHLKAMETYMRLKPFFVRGEFYGIDELTHIHTLSDKNSMVINCFNLEQDVYKKQFSVPLAEVGLDLSGEWQVRGTDDWKIVDNEFQFSLEIPAMGMRLIEIIPG